MSALTDNEVYLTAMPIDPQAASSNGTGYMIYKTAFGRVGVFSPLAEVGEQIGTNQSFICGQNLIDSRDSQSYPTSQMGAQCWMAKNINIGTAINGATEQTDNNVLEKYCYNNNSNNCNIYGGLYQWDEAMQYGALSPGAQGICPTDWHMPTEAEWTAITRFVINDPNCDPDTGCSPAGTELHVGGYYGFNIPLAGYRDLGGSFYDSGYSADLWTSSNGSDPWERYLVTSDPNIYRYTYTRSYGTSVRCVADESAACMPNCTNKCGGFNSCNGTCPDTCVGAQSCVNQICRDLINLTYTSSGNGSISGSSSQTISYGGNGTAVTAVPDSGYYFFNWSDGSTSNPRTDTSVTSNLSATANFVVNPCGVASSMTDSRDSQIYPIVNIYNQCWMAKNLNYGTMITGVTVQANNSISEKYCYANNSSNCSTYGGLYQWAEAVQYLNGATNSVGWSPAPTGNVQGLCPSGWHLPTDSEITSLTTYLGGVSVAGGKIKETTTTHWNSPNTGANNSSGFTALPNGERHRSTGAFAYLGEWANIWSSSNYNSLQAWSRALYSGAESVYLSASNKSYGYSIRCLKN
ncbi:hypothetical protein COT98_01805 [Candidatus Falkowbacteria bacterium CG10_big_fil_rev_8_21_14_0_10_39_9]|uniref:Fibrobacter succinogenes major paralogous domain-containing protein n=1 Tax=Candidatus Falkowbacteria bacterium CG10_big_fil_rev_8_21_14_0_10_39_9 TaxID=1974566 RepID=A0A2M6WQ13_9BACT|nr:MAG: hypothetical protein COT98_01805 [Candidatus Falkowbacteria bacterium CG10_big_fil_rev_8_21_14_0_10_39_9]